METKRPLYAYQHLIANVTKETDPDLIVFAKTIIHLSKLIREKGRDLALLNDASKLYSALARIRLLERHIAYHTEYGHLPLFPELQELTPAELTELKKEYHAQFQEQ